MPAFRLRCQRAVLLACLLALLPLPAIGDDSADPNPDLNPNADAHANDPAHQGHVHDDSLDELVVTFSGHERRRFDVIQGTSVLDEEELQRELRSSLGDTLAGQSGVNTTGFAPGASRPVIRGLDGPRLRVLQNSVGVLDVSTTSPDHQVASDPLLAQRVEVLRGAGTLRYGSNAVGGVVNVIDGRIAERALERPYEGAIGLHYGSNADDTNATGVIRGGVGPFVLHAEGFVRRTHDLEVKGDPLSSEERLIADPLDPLASVSDRVSGSDVESHGGTLGASWVGEDAFLGVAYARLESDYGVPIAPEEIPGPGIRIDLKQNRVDLAGGVRGSFGLFDGFEFRGVYGDYEHSELEGDEVATTFLNRGFEARLEATQAAIGNLDGSVGIQWRFDDRESIGAEAFLPAHEATQWAIFAVEELHLDPFTIEGGLRVERTELDADGPLRDRDFTTWSASLGASWALAADTILGLSLARTERPPTGEELYSNGPHFATAGFEVGDVGLDSETADAIELTLKRREGPITGALNLYYTRFDDFIFQEANGDIEDGLPVRIYRQTDADFYGLELDLAATVYEGAFGTARVDLGFDFVRGETDDDDLPRIPPTRLRLGAELGLERADLRAELEFIGDQDDVAPGERDTDGFVLLNLSATVRPFANDDVSFFVQARNLTDQRGRNHVSFLKERLPIAGRDIRFGMRWRF